MNEDDALIEEALTAGWIEPSPFFTARVMNAVRAAEELPPLPFPVWRFATALALLVFVIAGTLVLP